MKLREVTDKRASFVVSQWHPSVHQFPLLLLRCSLFIYLFIYGWYIQRVSSHTSPPPPPPPLPLKRVRRPGCKVTIRQRRTSEMDERETVWWRIKKNPSQCAATCSAASSSAPPTRKSERVMDVDSCTNAHWADGRLSLSLPGLLKNTAQRHHHHHHHHHQIKSRPEWISGTIKSHLAWRAAETRPHKSPGC